MEIEESGHIVTYLLHNDPNLQNSRRLQLSTFQFSEDPNLCEAEQKIQSDDSDSNYKSRISKPHPFNQKAPNDLVSVLHLSNEASEILASCLKEKNSLITETIITFYRARAKNYYIFFKYVNEGPNNYIYDIFK